MVARNFLFRIVVKILFRKILLPIGKLSQLFKVLLSNLFLITQKRKLIFVNTSILQKINGLFPLVKAGKVGRGSLRSPISKFILLRLTSVIIRDGVSTT